MIHQISPYNFHNCDSPLTFFNKLKIIFFFIIYISILPLFGLSFFIILIGFAAIYSMKKNKNFNIIIKSIKYMRAYIVLLSLLYVITNLEELKELEFLATTISIIGFFIFTCSSLFLRPLEEHQIWLMNNSIFFKKNINIQDLEIKEKNKIYSKLIKQELLNWKELFREDLITKKEFKTIEEELLKKN